MIYLDYNATTPLCDAAREAMEPHFSKNFGNASSIHRAGRNARAAVDNGRDKIASLLKAKPNEIVFTGGGTEACNLAVLGLARCRMNGGGHVICERTEHHAVLHAVEHLEKHEGFEVTWLDTSNDGIVDLDHLAKAIRPETRLVSIMTANNETGVIQPVREISKICRDRGVLLHSDCVQAFGKIDIDMSLVDAASFAAHKFYGPKGVGFLFLRSGLSLQPVLFGGSHENQRRPGTENVPAIAGMAAAAEFVLSNRDAEQKREEKFRDELWNLISQNVPEARLNGENAPRLANTLNVSLMGIDSEMLLIALDLKGVCASSGSACMVGSVSASHVLLAMGLPIERARSAVRLSLGKQTTAEEIAATGKIIGEIVDRVTKRKSAHTVA
ncbi:MAG TPA: cysteine desulfurase family protein [Chthoniobacterales bacterium]|nr:cysteine desulfurase family protein [Chthoniobacterales bacterium]